jgi:hypothetical protein
VGLLAAVKHTLTRRLLLWLASESRLWTLLHETLSDVSHRIDVTVESLGNIMVGLIGAICIDLKQNISMLDLIGCGFARCGEFDKLLTLLVAESNNIADNSMIYKEL